MNPYFIIMIRTIIMVVLLTVALKIMGKREVGQLSIFDFLIVLSIADVMIICIENYEQTILYSIIPLVIIVTLQKIVSIVDLKFPKIRRIVDGKANIIIFKGKINTQVMKKENYNMSDLYVQLREKNIRDISEVEYAILEINGNLSVFTFKENDDNCFPIPIIISGIINYSALDAINKDINWLNGELKKQKIDNIKDIFGASYKNGHLEIVKEGKNEKTDF